MLVWLAEHLVKYYSGFNVFSYLTFRAIVSLLTALFISLWMGPRMIARLQKLSFGQVVRNDGPESHFSKRGTPTMGGSRSSLRSPSPFCCGLTLQPVRLVRTDGINRLRDHRLC